MSDETPHDLRSLSDVLDELGDAGDGDAVSVNDVLDAFADRSLGALLTVLGALAALPIVGAIPGVSVLIGALVVLACLRSFVGGGSWRLPSAIGGREVEDDELERGVERARPWAERIDRWLRPRLTPLTRGAVARAAIAVGAAALGVALVPLAVVPFGALVPALGIVAFGLALIGRDGVFALVGVAFAAGALALLRTAA